MTILANIWNSIRLGAIVFTIFDIICCCDNHVSINDIKCWNIFSKLICGLDPDSELLMPRLYFESKCFGSVAIFSYFLFLSFDYQSHSSFWVSWLVKLHTFPKVFSWRTDSQEPIDTIANRFFSEDFTIEVKKNLQRVAGICGRMDKESSFKKAAPAKIRIDNLFSSHVPFWSKKPVKEKSYFAALKKKLNSTPMTFKHGWTKFIKSFPISLFVPSSVSLLGFWGLLFKNIVKIP